MNLAAAQRRIDSLEWYHDFDFGGGLRAVSEQATRYRQRPLWKFIEGEMDRVDFAGKSVLDIGCWDGYWSFYAERRGARSVLASDDATQNFMGSQGLHLARELLGSKVETNLDTSVYQLERLGRKFDIILFLGVYYHLFAPYYALAQLRHCCHPDTVVLIDGPVSIGLPEGAGLFQFPNHACEFLPTLGALRQLLGAAYLSEEHHSIYFDEEDERRRADGLAKAEWGGEPVGWRWRLGACVDVLLGKRKRIREKVGAVIDFDPRRRVFPPEAHQRVFLKCRPFSGINEVHSYPPPFGLAKYDDRFAAKVV